MAYTRTTPSDGDQGFGHHGWPGAAVMAIAVASDIFAATGKRIPDLLIKQTKLG